MNNNQKLGKKGEELASLFLEEKGYQIIEKNYSCWQGEIDIIAKEKNTLVFIEVKTRKNMSFGSPAEAVNKIKQIHLYNVAKYYIFIKRLKNPLIRFDVVEVIYEYEKYRINHIKQII